MAHLRNLIARMPFRERLEGIWAFHGALLLNASALAGSTFSTAAMGIVYWWLASRFFAADAVGLASAEIAGMNFLGLIGDFGLGTAMIGQVSKQSGRAGPMISAGLATAATCSAAFGLLYMLMLKRYSPELAELTNRFVLALTFVVGAGLTGLVLVLDQALIGMLAGHFQFWRNVTFAAVKLALLAAAVLAGLHTGAIILATWVAGLMASLALLALFAKRVGAQVLYWPDFRVLGTMSGTILAHHTLNICSQAPSKLMPLLVAYILSARINAGFNVAWQLIGVAFLVSAALTTSLYAVSGWDPSIRASKFRFTLGISIAFSVAAILGCLMAGGFVLRLFNGQFPEIASSSLSILALALPAVALKYHFIALRRIESTIVGGLPLLAVGAFLELVGAAAGAYVEGLPGLSAGWTVATYIEAAFMAPSVLNALASRPAHAEISRVLPADSKVASS